MQENKHVLELKNTEEKVYQNMWIKLFWFYPPSQCALIQNLPRLNNKQGKTCSLIHGTILSGNYSFLSFLHWVFNILFTLLRSHQREHILKNLVPEEEWDVSDLKKRPLTFLSYRMTPRSSLTINMPASWESVQSGAHATLSKSFLRLKKKNWNWVLAWSKI